LLTLENFWLPLMGEATASPSKEVTGWFASVPALSTFVEAPLAPNDELTNGNDIREAKVILVSAPGAVGKSTLAKEIAARTGVVYIDLAVADAVGANTISGGLAKSGLFNDWSEQKTTLLIDGLDEARLRVTQEAFEAFLRDVASLCIDRHVPVAMFGRTGAVQDAWLIMESLVSIAVLEIGYYDRDTAIDFTCAQLANTREGSRHPEAERNAISLLLEKLRDETQSDGTTFSGYAPVLQAVAERVAKEPNPSALIASVEKGEKPVTLQTVVAAILERERSKLSGVTFDDPALNGQLYTPEEQLARLVARVLGGEQPQAIAMSSTDAQKYDAALSTWVPEHPFLNGRDQPSSAVFEAMILVTALLNGTASDIAIKSQLARGAAANPFLADFYSDAIKNSEFPTVPPEHLGIIYSSIRARLAIGETANLTVEAGENAAEEELLKADVEISVVKKGLSQDQLIRFSTNQVGTLYLGPHIEDVVVIAPLSRVEIGAGTEATLVAPVDIECERLVINASRLIVEAPVGHVLGSVSLVADDYQGGIASVPAVRSETTLSVIWPGARSHPWTNFASEARVAQDNRIEEALRRFRKFVIAFRSHSKGSLARFKDKLDHERMTKGTGQAVLDYMIKRDIITTDGTMYYLDPDKLGSETGATYADCITKNFQPKTITFIEEAIG